jgi:hypothetical protein
MTEIRRYCEQFRETNVGWALPSASIRPTNDLSDVNLDTDREIAKSATVSIARAAPRKSTEPCAARRARTSIWPGTP